MSIIAIDKRTKILTIVLLLLLPPITGELLSGSAPPLVFFNPLMILMLVLLYGCGALLIREMRARWNLQWSVIFLAVAYGIIEEGIMVKSFFNPGWVDLGALSGYDMFFGVQWPWTIELILYHATVSMLIPITIVGLLWPQYADTPLLKKRGTIFAITGLSLVTVLGMIFMGTREEDKMVPFYPNPLLWLGSVAAVALLIWLAYRYRNSRVSINTAFIFSPLGFGVIGFLFQAFNLFVPNILAGAEVPAPITLSVQLFEIVLVLLFTTYQIYNLNITRRHIVWLIFGSLLFFILLTPVQEFSPGRNPDPTRGMIVVGIISLILLIIWTRAVLKNKGEKGSLDHPKTKQ
jgi:hypothetical protein